MSRLPIDAFPPDDENDSPEARDPFAGLSATEIREFEEWQEEQRAARVAAFLALPPVDGPDPPF